MAATLRIRASTDGTLDKADVYGPLRAIPADELSESSPVSPRCREVAVATGDGWVELRVGGHDGEWSHLTQDTLRQTLAGIDGVDAASIDVEGGVDADAAAGDESDESDGQTDVSEITGVGPQRAEELRDAGLSTVSAVLDAGVEGLVDVGISDGVAANIIENAE